SIVHYWYLCWLIPFSIFQPRLSMLWISVSSALYFLTNYYADTSAYWHLPIWASALQWLPFFILLGYEWLQRNSFASKLSAAEPVDGYDVVIPIYKDYNILKTCLAGISSLRTKPHRVYVVDADSAQPQSVDMSGEIQVRWLHSELGRGNQIARGVKAATSDVIVVLHADSTLNQDSACRIIAYLNANPESVGGVLGQRFDQGKVGLFIIEILNDLRAVFGSTGFGDQVQFFRRKAIKQAGGFPSIPLMEDVETSWRLRKVGALGFLDAPVISSSRSWLKTGFFKRLFTVLSCVARYRIARIRGENNAEELYQYYYKS
ncbi:MAG: hypothetical protein CUN55_14840, partial [Phototrophicales bacterium]